MCFRNFIQETFRFHGKDVVQPEKVFIKSKGNFKLNQQFIITTILKEYIDKSLQRTTKCTQKIHPSSHIQSHTKYNQNNTYTKHQ